MKTEGVGVSLRPGAPPTMVSVPSVLDKLSASSLVSPDLLQTSAQSPSSSANHQSDEDVNEENLDMSTGEFKVFYIYFSLGEHHIFMSMDVYVREVLVEVNFDVLYISPQNCFYVQ